MKRFYFVLIVLACYACAPASKDSATSDSTGVEQDSTTIGSTEMEERGDGGYGEGDEGGDENEDVAYGEGDEPTGSLDANGKYTITNQGSYVSDPFGFSLDTTTVRELLGPEAVITYTETPAGKDEMGDYSGYTYFEVEAGKTKMSFYSYSGKHYALVYTSVLQMSKGIMVGTSKDDFIEIMGLTGDDPHNAKVFTIDDDYGSMSFYFDGDELEHIYVSYEEGD